MKHRLLVVMLLLACGCHAYIPVVSDVEVLPVRMLEWREFEAKKQQKPATQPLIDPMNVPEPFNSEQKLNLNAPPPEINFTHAEFRVYAAKAKWDDTTVDLLLKGGYRNPERFMCGGRMVKLI